MCTPGDRRDNTSSSRHQRSSFAPRGGFDLWFLRRSQMGVDSRRRAREGLGQREGAREACAPEGGARFFMRRNLLTGLLLAAAAVLVVALSATFDLDLESVALLEAR